jgi:hypothetical protein
MTETMRDLVKSTIDNKDARYVDANDVREGFAIIATVRNVEERKNIRNDSLDRIKAEVKAVVQG